MVCIDDVALTGAAGTGNEFDGTELPALRRVKARVLPLSDRSAFPLAIDAGRVFGRLVRCAAEEESEEEGEDEFEYFDDEDEEDDDLEEEDEFEEDEFDDEEEEDEEEEDEDF